MQLVTSFLCRTFTFTNCIDLRGLDTQHVLSSVQASVSHTLLFVLRCHLVPLPLVAHKRPRSTPLDFLCSRITIIVVLSRQRGLPLSSKVSISLPLLLSSFGFLPLVCPYCLSSPIIHNNPSSNGEAIFPRSRFFTSVAGLDIERPCN